MTAHQVRRALQRALSVVPPVPTEEVHDLNRRAQQVVRAVREMLDSLGRDASDAEWRRDPVCRELAEQLLGRQAEWMAALKRARHQAGEQRVALQRARSRVRSAYGG